MKQINFFDLYFTTLLSIVELILVIKMIIITNTQSWAEICFSLFVIAVAVKVFLPYVYEICFVWYELMVRS